MFIQYTGQQSGRRILINVDDISRIYVEQSRTYGEFGVFVRTRAERREMELGKYETEGMAVKAMDQLIANLERSKETGEMIAVLPTQKDVDIDSGNKFQIEPPSTLRRFGG